MLDEVHEQDVGIEFLRRLVSGNLTSPLLLVGQEGVGRRFAVIQATKELFCMGERQAGCKCAACTQIDAGLHTDFTIIQPPDDKEIGIDAIREMIDLAQMYPQSAPVRMFLIDGADRLTGAAANAFLKTLEEPPKTARFLLTAESQNTVIPTVRSRCGLVVFRRLSEPFVLSVLQRFEKDPAKALVYARLGEGSVGRAIQYWGSGRLGLRDKVLALVKQGLDGDLPSLFSAVDSIGTSLPLGLRFLEQILLDLRMARINPARVINRDISEELERVGTTLSDTTWHRLVVGLRKIRAYYRTTRIVLPFHIKALFASAFVGS